MPVRLKCKECGKRYYTAKTVWQVEESDKECQECEGGLKISKSDSWVDEDGKEEKRAEGQG